MTHTLYLAYRYGLNSHKGTFPPEHQNKMMDRRYRIVEELISHWIYSERDTPPDTKLYNYPVLDLQPTNSASEGWKPLDSTALSQLTPELRNRRPCYVGCPDKKTLSKHCEQITRFYPGYENSSLSPMRDLRAFREWVEKMDDCRRTRNYKAVGSQPLPFPENQPRSWINPSGRTSGGRSLW